MNNNCSNSLDANIIIIKPLEAFQLYCQRYTEDPSPHTTAPTTSGTIVDVHGYVEIDEVE